jgi:hypothetical protein
MDTDVEEEIITRTLVSDPCNQETEEQWQSLTVTKLSTGAVWEGERERGDGKEGEDRGRSMYRIVMDP